MMDMDKSKIESYFYDFTDNEFNIQIIENGKDGILVSVGNEESLAHALDYLLSNTRARLLIGKNAKEKAKEFTEEQVVSKWYQYFENVLNR